MIHTARPLEILPVEDPEVIGCISHHFQHQDKLNMGS